MNNPSYSLGFSNHITHFSTFCTSKGLHTVHILSLIIINQTTFSKFFSSILSSHGLITLHLLLPILNNDYANILSIGNQLLTIGIQKPSLKVKQNSNQPEWSVHKTSVQDRKPSFNRCHKADETAFHILCDCKCLKSIKAQTLSH